MFIPDNKVQEIRERIDILEIIGDYVSLKKKGQNWWALSPFVNEKTPSFSVAPHKGIFKDFSTGKGGDAISFLMELESISYVEALKMLAERYGVELDLKEPTPEEIQETQRKDSVYIALKMANDFFMNSLKNTEEGKSIGLSYFKERGINHQSIEDFGLGYSPDAWDALMQHAEKSQYKKDILEAAGLITVREDGRAYDRFRGRVMFPIYSVSGRVLGFGARALKKGDKAKYLNSPETEVYHKSSVLYGLHQAKQHIRTNDECLLVEGYTDVISLYQSGIKNVVASSGTSLTNEQIRLIRRYTPNVTVLFDGDAAGVKASMRGVDMLVKEGLNVRIVLLPDGQDPDSFVQANGTQKTLEFLKSEQKDFILFKANLLATETKDDPIKRADTIRDVVRTISLVPDNIKRQVFFKECASVFGMDEDTLIREGEKLIMEEVKRQQSEQKWKERRAERFANENRAQQARGQKGQDTPSNPTGEPKQPSSGDLDIEGMSFSEEEDFFMPIEGEAVVVDSNAPDVNYSPQEPLPEVQVSLPVNIHKEHPLFKQQYETLRILLHYGLEQAGEGTLLCDYVFQETKDIEFDHPIYSKIFNTYLGYRNEGRKPSINALLATDDDAVKNVIADILSNSVTYEISEAWDNKFNIFVPTEDHNVVDVAYKNIINLKFRSVQKMYHVYSEKLKHEKDQVKQEELLVICMELKTIEGELNKVLEYVVSSPE